MPRGTRPRFSRLVVLAFTIVLGLGLVTRASADGPPELGPGGSAPAPPLAGCAVLRVQLNGMQPATQTCLAPAPATQGMIASASVPVISNTDCFEGDVQLFVDSNFGGSRICFGGEGWTSLTTFYYQPWWWINFVLSWNDEVSSFNTGAHYVNFYENTLMGGAKLRYASFQSRAAMPSGWNDRVSSLCLLGPNSPCP
jgi:hypothetical protein